MVFHLVAKKLLKRDLTNRATDENALEIDFGAIDFSTPQMTLPSSIGNGVSFISKFMTSRLHRNHLDAKTLLEYLQALNHNGEVQK